MQTTLPAETVEQAIEMICSGSSLKKASDDLRIPFGTLWRAVNSEKYVDKYTRAQDDRANVLVESILDVADDPNIDPKDKAIRVDARKWIASKILPKRYGDRLDVTGAVGAALTINVIQRFGDKPIEIEDAQVIVPELPGSCHGESGQPVDNSRSGKKR